MHKKLKSLNFSVVLSVFSAEKMAKGSAKRKGASQRLEKLSVRRRKITMRGPINPNMAIRRKRPEGGRLCYL